MDQLVYVSALLVALSNSSGGAENCPASRATSFTFSVASHRNLTGHWIVSVDASRDDPKQFSQRNTSRGMTVDVGQKTASCQTSESVQLSATVSLAATRIPPDGYDVVNGLGYYKMHATALTWTEARDKCMQEGAHLIILNSDQEAEVVRTFFDRKSSIPNDALPNHCFTGLHDRNKEGEFITVLGEALASTGFTRWAPNEPNGGTGENCVTIFKPLLSLCDVGCNHKLSFICEYSP